MPRITHKSRLRCWIALLLAIALVSHLAAGEAIAAHQLRGTKDGAQSSQVDVRKLKLGTPIERELKGGESHAYEISLEAGQYLHLTVDQRGIDVVVRVIAPEGKQLMEVDSPNGRQGLEHVECISEAAGSYQVQVAALETNEPPGKYEIKIVTLRVATEKDRTVKKLSTLDQPIEKLKDAGKYDQALPMAERTLAIRERP